MREFKFISSVNLKENLDDEIKSTSVAEGDEWNSFSGLNNLGDFIRVNSCVFSRSNLSEHVIISFLLQLRNSRRLFNPSC